MKRVLLADDKAIFREPLAAMLRREGYDVQIATDGNDALASAREHHPDIILLDAAMPIMDGITCAQQMRSDEQLSAVPIIMVSAETDRGIMQSALKAGVQQYLVKTQFTTEELMASISETLSREATIAPTS